MKKRLLLLLMFLLLPRLALAGSLTVPFNGGTVATQLTIQAGGVLLPDGSVSAPSLAFVNDTDTGIYNSANGVLQIVSNSVTKLLLTSSYTQSTASSFILGSATTLTWGNSDLLQSRDGAASQQWGLDAATPIAQTLKGHDGSGTDKTGAKISIAGGNGTGTAVGGEVCLASTPAGGASGSTQNTSTERVCAPVDGGFRWQTAAEAACDAAHRGVVNYVAGGAGVLDTFKICRKDAADAYAWVAWGTAL